MSGWAIFAMVLALCMCLGPIMLMQPTGRQRNIAKLRAKAAELGLKVRAGSVKRIEGTQQLFVYYRPWSDEERRSTHRLEPWCLIRHSFEHALHFYQCWAFEGKRKEGLLKGSQVVYEELNALPESVLAIECSVSGLGVYWREEGGEDTLIDINIWLNRFVEQLAIEASL